jgi:predicted N-acetyltransferase YhbS
MTAIRPARPEEAPAISALALRSKGHWGYGAEAMAVFRTELTISPAELRAARAHVVEDEGALAGFYTLRARGEGVIELEHLFVDPTRLRRGLGAALFRHAREGARLGGFRRMIILSDPHAAGFYQAMGAHLQERVPSSIPGREIPVFALDLLC